MAKRIIIIHGRSTKPAKRSHIKFLNQALVNGMRRVDAAKADSLAREEIEIDHAYYGDINNKILYEKSAKHRETLKAHDPDSGNGVCLPDGEFPQALDRLASIDPINKAAYKKTLSEFKDFRFVDDAARAVSTIAAITSFTFLNEQAIKLATSDMGAYLLTRSTGSAVRERLQSILKPALKNGDDICLIAHSMGCIVSYDVLWKFSRMSEYRDVQNAGTKVSKWITLGCPLGEAGVKANLYDANERATENGTDKHPINIIKDWHNIAAYDDFISHDMTMKDDFSNMLKFGHVESIEDSKIYNCFAMDEKANPHKFHGYLDNDLTARSIAEWMD